jgi:hypothetical protein
MQTLTVALDRGEARRLYREYRKHQHWSRPIDWECQRAYQLIAAGRMIIQAIESVRRAGVKTEGEDAGFPKLALCRADATACTAAFSHDGSLAMTADDYRARYRWRGANNGPIPSPSLVAWAAGSFPRPPGAGRWRAAALVPSPPLHLRPKRGLANYHTLFEAEWTKIPPHDPLLLRRIGKGDLWLVVAQWNLTPVERAALATRI